MPCFTMWLIEFNKPPSCFFFNWGEYLRWPTWDRDTKLKTFRILFKKGRRHLGILETNMATILVGTVRGDCEEGRDAIFSPSPPPSPTLFCPYHAGYWYRRLQRHDLTGKLRTINSLARLFLTQDKSIVMPLVERITM